MTKAVSARKKRSQDGEQLRVALNEAEEQQTATSEILRVIASSPTDLQPVLDVVAENAARVCGASDASIALVEANEVRRVAWYSTLQTSPPTFAAPLRRDSIVGRAVLDGRTIHLPDVAPLLNTEYPASKPAASASGARTLLVTPLVRQGVPIGTILIRRLEVRPFTDKQIALLKTFADQAVIAIENVRLFKELEARNRDLTTALERQTATSETLRVISSSPTDVQPVFDAIVRSGVRLCDAVLGAVFRLDDGLVHLVGIEHPRPAVVAGLYPAPITAPLPPCRAIHENTIIHVPESEAEGALPPEGARVARLSGLRSLLVVPMRRDGSPIGAILVARPAVGPFPDEQIALLQTFADQAVIAIENVRLFKELAGRNRDLTEALEQQTATSEILRVISSSPTDVQPVFDAIARNAVRLCGALYGMVWRSDGRTVELVGHYNLPLEEWEAARRLPPRPVEGNPMLSTVIRAGGVLDIPDVEEYSNASPEARARWRTRGVRSVTMVPMRHQAGVVGFIGVSHREVAAFSPSRVELLKTFADQAVIAIENVRLYRELEQKSRELEAASQHKSEFLANMSHELRTPLNAIIGFSEVLTERMFGDLNEKQDEYLKDINASGTHLLSLINDILDLSKIEAGRMELEVTVFDLPTAIDNALTLVRERAGRRGVTLRRTVQERLGEVRGDERKIRQVILNLLSNAIKFTPEGGGIEVTATQGDSAVEISVTDTGIGIAPEDQEAVFEEFRQVGGADKRAEGTGLGLALCRKFVELHGGRIWVRSQVGAGSTFTFMLPMER